MSECTRKIFARKYVSTPSKNMLVINKYTWNIPGFCKDLSACVCVCIFGRLLAVLFASVFISEAPLGLVMTHTCMKLSALMEQQQLHPSSAITADSVGRSCSQTSESLSSRRSLWTRGVSFSKAACGALLLFTSPGTAHIHTLH